MRTRLAFSGLAVAAIAVFVFGQRPPSGAPARAPSASAREPILVTPNTVRVSGPNVYAACAAITQLTYGATHHEDRPHAVTLVRSDRKADAILAASRITHFPVNAPVLFVEADRIPAETFAELKRLGPDGNDYDNDVQVYLVGPISERVEREVQEKLGYATRAFRLSDPILLAEELDKWAAAVHGDHPDEVVIVQYDRLDTALAAAAWNAHMGQGIFFVRGETIPDATRRALGRRFRREAFVYLFGDETVISRSVQAELDSYGHVQRVPGRDAFEISANFASFHDAGFNQGWWLGSWNRDFGWDIGEAGHNFTFVNPANWQQAVTGSLLAHMGKHGPMILLSSGQLTDPLRRYLERVRPTWTAPSDQLFNHGWILGGTEAIPRQTQLEIDDLFEPK